MLQFAPSDIVVRYTLEPEYQLGIVSQLIHSVMRFFLAYMAIQEYNSQAWRATVCEWDYLVEKSGGWGDGA